MRFFEGLNNFEANLKWFKNLEYFKVENFLRLYKYHFFMIFFWNFPADGVGNGMPRIKSRIGDMTSYAKR